MIKLYNSSPFEDATLKAILTHAAKAVGCRIGNPGVIVKVTRGGRGIQTRSYASGCNAVRRWALIRRGGNRWIATDGGYVVMRPQHSHCGDYLWAAENLYRTACHELGHIRDMQNHERFDTRRLQWRHRIQEVRAEQYADIAMGVLHDGEAPRALEDHILDLAVQWEAFDDRQVRRRLRRADRAKIKCDSEGRVK